MKSTLKDGGGKNLLFESTIFTGKRSQGNDELEDVSHRLTMPLAAGKKNLCLNAQSTFYCTPPYELLLSSLTHEL